MEREGHSVIKRHSFGISPIASGCVHWLDEGTLIYPVGKTLALHNIASNNQRFIEASFQSTSISAVSISANHKFVAIAESGASPQVQIIDTLTRKRRKTLSVADLQSDRFVSVAFSADGRHLVTQGGAPGWNMYYWNWERSKPLAAISLSYMLRGRSVVQGGAEDESGESSAAISTQLSAGKPLVTHVEVSPADPLLISASGAGMMRYFQYVDGVLKPVLISGLTRENAEVFATHRWVDPRHVIASTQRGELFIISNDRFFGKVTMPPAEGPAYLDSPPQVTSIVPTRNGFVAGTDQGRLLLFRNNAETIEVDDCSGTQSGDGSMVSASQKRTEELSYTLLYQLKVPTRDPGEDVRFESTGERPGQGETDWGEGSDREPSRVPTAEKAESQIKKKSFQLNVAGVPVTSTVETERPPVRLPVDAAEVRARAENERTRPMNGVSGIALDQTESHLAFVTNVGKIFGFTFRQNWVSMTPEKEPEMEPICQRFHTGRINSIDCSVRKPFLITASSDCSVRVWNTTNNKLEICTFFQQEPKAVAIHPNGLMAVICFPSKVRVMSVLWNSLRDRRDINFRNGNLVKFAVGGQYFAIAHGNLIDVFSSATCEAVGQLRGHPQKIKDMKWCATSPYPTDNRLITCSTDGMMIDWNITEMRKEVEHSDKRFQYMAVASDDRNVWTIAAPTSSTALEVYWKVTLREIDRHAIGTPGCASEDYEFTETSLQQLTISPHQRMLFAGCEDGCIKSMPFPLQAGVQLPPLPAHGASVTGLCLSYDENTLFTCSEDGVIFVWNIREEGGRAKVQEGNQYLAEEVLVTQQEMEERRNEIEFQQQQIDRLKTDLDSEEKRRNHEQGTRLRERSEEFKSELAALSAQYATLWNTKAEQERSFVTIKLEKEAEGMREIEALERARQAEVEQLEETCEVLQTTMEKERVSHAQELKNLELLLKREREEETEHFNDVLSQRKETIEKLTRQTERSNQTNEETIHQLEMDTDAEMLGIHEKNSAVLSSLRERYLRMKGEGAIMRKNAGRMEKEIEVRVKEIRLLDQAKAALTTQLAELSHRMSQLHQDIEERDVVIGDREKVIYALKKQNQELEKHKFVLDHRIRQLKAQMEPKQREIVHHNQKIMQKNGELESFHANNIALRTKIEDLKKEIVEQRRQRGVWINKTKDFETYKKRFQKDVGELALGLQEPERLRSAVIQLYETHFTARNGRRIAQSNPEILQEFSEQLGYLSTSVDALRHKVCADQERHKKEIASMMMENLTLIREIHDLRDEIQVLRGKVAADEATRRSQGTLLDRSASVSLAAASGSNSALPSSQPAASGEEGRISRLAAASRCSRVSQRTSGTRAGIPGSAKPGSAGVQIPEPPKMLEQNRVEIAALRAYIESMERCLGEAMRPGSGFKTLPPIATPLSSTSQLEFKASSSVGQDVVERSSPE